MFPTAGGALGALRSAAEVAGVLPARKADARSGVDTDARWRKRLTATPAYRILSALGASSIVSALANNLLVGAMTDDTSLRN